MSTGQSLTKALAIDCEMVETAGQGPNGFTSMVARVSLVNEFGQCVYDTYVKSTKPVTDYRTAYSGITANHLNQGRQFSVVREDVRKLIAGRRLVGHALDKDLRVLDLTHPESSKRDTATYPPLRTARGPPSLRDLSVKYLGGTIQAGSHSSVTVTDYRTQWSGVQPHHIAGGRYFVDMKADVANLIRGRLLIGHSMDKDLRVLGLGHPEWNKRDTAYYFQTDARATMMIYKQVEDEWEESEEESSEEEDNNGYYYDSSSSSDWGK